jgi:Fe-S-cluster containining protein
MTVGLTKGEICKLSKIIPEEKFVRYYNGDKKDPVLRHKKDGTCVFLDKEGCVLGGRKPISCKFYPFGIMKKEEDYYLIRWTNVCKSFPEVLTDDDHKSMIKSLGPNWRNQAFEYEEILKRELAIVCKIAQVENMNLLS